MADVNISKYRASVVRDGSKPASPGFVVSEGQDPVNPPGTNNFVPYTGATANVELGEFGVEAGFVTLDTTPTNIPTDQGAIYWDDTRSTAALIMNGTLQHIGQDSFFYVKNSSGSTIPKGTCVGFAGTDGGSGHLLITPFLANGSVPSTYFMGVTSEEIANGSFGQVMHFGELEGINTSGFTAGALLYASSTVAGAFQTTAPVAPNNIILVASAVNSKNNGAIVVRPTLGSNINTDEGVKITSPTTGDLLQLQSGGLWENKTLAQVIGSAYVPSTRTITINGTTQDLSANRTFNVGTVTSVGLSSATSGVTIGSTPVTSSGTITLAIATASGSQNGLLSSTDWTTFNNKQNALTNPVTGTGTTNRLAKFTGASTIGNSNISDGGVTILNENPVAGQFAWQFNGNTTTGQSFGASVVAGTNSSDIAFRVLNAAASSNYFVVRGDGNVGIGTASVSGTYEKLAVAGGISIKDNTNAKLEIGRYNTTGAQNSYIKLGANSNSLRFTNNTDIADIMELTNSGNLGLGVTPSAWSSAFGSVLQFKSAGSNGGGALTGSGGTNFRMFANTFYDGSYKYIVNGRATQYEQDGYHAWYNSPSGTAGNAISFTQAMTLTSGGNLLVGGTSDNGARLQVSGTSTFTKSAGAGNVASFSDNTYGLDFATTSTGGSLQTYNTNQTLDLKTYGTGTINLYTSNTERLRITSGGNVGIGTTSPGRALEVYRAGSATAQLKIGDASTSKGYLGVFSNALYINAGGTFDSGWTTDGSNGIAAIVLETTNGGSAIAFGTAGSNTSPSERMRITSGGNVLIGTTTDAGARLYITGGLVSNMLSLRSNNGLSTNINFTSESPGGSSDNYTINHTMVHGSGGGYRIEHNVTSRWIRMISGTGGVELAGAATSWASISDIRQKDVLQKGIPNALEKIKGLDAIFYKYKNEEISQTSNQTVVTNDLIKIKQRRIGLIAQQVYESLPEAVKYNENEDVYRLSYTEIIPLIVEAIKELNEKIK